MKLIINKKKINIVEKNNFLEKLKGIKFILEPIKDAYRFKSHYANTYFLFQRVDIIMTDENNKVLYIYPNCKTEKLIFPKFNVKYVYFLPLETTKDLEINQILKISKPKEKN